MGKILNIETSTRVCSVALSVDGKTVALQESNTESSHARQITVFAEQIMYKSGFTFQDLDAIAVSKGPGSYTGLRIGVSTAKGFCYSLDKPLISVGTLKSLSNGMVLKLVAEGKNPDDFLHHTEPGGPSRVLYLSELQKGHGSIGFIMANGEKIGEWIHWLAFAKFARTQEGGQKLRVFEVSIERPWTKDGVLMSTSPPYSIFSSDGQETYLDVSRLRNFDMPSRFRSMLVITQSDNDRVVNIMRRHDYLEIDLTF